MLPAVIVTVKMYIVCVLLRGGRKSCIQYWPPGHRIIQYMLHKVINCKKKIPNILSLDFHREHREKLKAFARKSVFAVVSNEALKVTRYVYKVQ